MPVAMHIKMSFRKTITSLPESNAAAGLFSLGLMEALQRWFEHDLKSKPCSSLCDSGKPPHLEAVAARSASLVNA